MSRRSTRSGPKNPPSTSSEPAEFAPGEPRIAESEPVVVPRWIRRLLSFWVPIHLLAVGVSFFSVVSPSQTMGTLLNFFQPYLRATRFGIDDRPIYLAHGSASEQPLRIQISSRGVGEDADWRTIEPGGTAGLARNDRYHRWLASAVLLAESDQLALAAEFLVPVARRESAANAIRILRLPTQLTTVVDDALPPPYEAMIVRDAGRISLIQLPSTSQAARAVDEEEEARP